VSVTIRRATRYGLCVFMLLATWACDKNVPDPVVSSVSVYCGQGPSSNGYTLVGRGATIQCNASAKYSNGIIAQEVEAVAWQSSNTTVATVSPPGLVTDVGTGTASISATFQGVTGSAVFTVSGCLIC
jgi:hypothetical protein